jgi:lipid-binding SYLF domain-containing protein
MKTPEKNGMIQRASQGAWVGLALLLMVFILTIPRMSQAAAAWEINRDVTIALEKLYRTTPSAKKMAEISKAVLVFPSVIKGGFIVGGQYGEGALRKGEKTTGYYKTVSASYGFQAGAQSFGYALFFLDDESLKYLKNSKGWELGIGPTIVVVDEGAARSLSTTTAKSGVYAFFFNQKGLMAGISIQGSKITQFTPEK